MNLVEVQGHKQCVLVPIIAGPATRRPEAERLVEIQGRHVGRTHLEVDVAGVGISSEGGTDQGAGVSAPSVLGSYSDGGDVQLTEDVADPDVASDLATDFGHQVEAIGTH
jgi:hypothetical protein